MINTPRKATTGRNMTGVLADSLIVAMGADNTSNEESPADATYSNLNLIQPVFPPGLDVATSRLLLLASVEVEKIMNAEPTSGRGDFVIALNDDSVQPTDIVATISADLPIAANGDPQERTAWTSYLSVPGDPRVVSGMFVSTWCNNPNSVNPPAIFRRGRLWWFLLAPNP